MRTDAIITDWLWYLEMRYFVSWTVIIAEIVYILTVRMLIELVTACDRDVYETFI